MFVVSLNWLHIISKNKFIFYFLCFNNNVLHKEYMTKKAPNIANLEILEIPAFTAYCK